MHMWPGLFSVARKLMICGFQHPWVGTGMGWRCFGLQSLHIWSFLTHPDKFSKSAHIPVSNHYHLFSLLKILW